MLSKKKRITKEIFQNLIKGGKTFSTPLFLFYYKESNLPQYAFVAPKGIFKKAVERNKFRRSGYNTLRYIPIRSGSGIFIYKKQAFIANSAEIKENILFILKKTGISL